MFTSSASKKIFDWTKLQQSQKLQSQIAHTLFILFSTFENTGIDSNVVAVSRLVQKTT